MSSNHDESAGVVVSRYTITWIIPGPFVFVGELSPQALPVPGLSRAIFAQPSKGACAVGKSYSRATR